MNEAHERLERLLGGPALAALRQRLRRRYELGRRNDTFTVSDVSAIERHALEGLLARPSRDGRSMRFSIAELDQALARAGLADSLSDALARLDGPIHERAAERLARAAEWQTIFAEYKATPQLEALVGDSAGRALVKRVSASDPARARSLLQSLTRVIACLPRQEAPHSQSVADGFSADQKPLACGMPLSCLAAEALGDAHALDEGRAVSTLLLAALRQGDSERSREVWARHAVLVGELVSPALVLNLRAQRDTPGGLLIEEARALGEPVHLTLRALLRTPPQWRLQERHVHVCENPAVVAMAADRLGPRCAPLVCTEGMPSAAQRTLLAQLAAAGARLHYHGDFDWSGIAIGNFVIRSFNALPWRFGAADYVREARPAGRGLTDAPVAAQWDAGLMQSMLECGYALEEEAVVESLLEDLRGSRDLV
jgi:uncharacterized protein (TIGR02679 family)